MTEPTLPGSVPAPPKGRRLAWLDAMRGFAALCVVFDHMGSLVLQRPHDLVYDVLDTGQYGVFVFFLVSGYIIPASLERKGSVRGFWVSRVFRLYPLYIVAIALSLLAFKTGFGGTARRGEHAQDLDLLGAVHDVEHARRHQRAQRDLDPLLRDGLLPAADRAVHLPGPPAQRRLRAGRGRGARWRWAAS